MAATVPALTSAATARPNSASRYPQTVANTA